MTLPFLGRAAGTPRARSGVPVVVNPVPTDIALSAATIAFNAASGAVVGVLSVTDPGESSWTFAITGGAGAAKFTLSTSTGATVQLLRGLSGTLTAGVSETIDIRVTDGAGGQRTETFTVSVYDPTAVAQVTTLVVEGTGAASGKILRFAHPFKKGDVPAGSPILLRQSSDDAAWRTQFTPKTYWSDGSVKWGLIATELPSIANGSTVTMKVMVNDTHGSPGADINPATALSGRSASLAIAGGGGSTQTIDLVAGAIASSDTWESGPLVVERRVTTNINSASWGSKTSGRTLVDVAITKAGDLLVDLGLSNDRVALPDSNAATMTSVDFTLTLDGSAVLTATGKTIALYTGFIRAFGRTSGGTNLTTTETVHFPAYVRHNPAYLATAGVPRFDATNGYDTSQRASWDSARAAGGWNNVLTQTSAGQMRGIPENTDQTGGRDDIGPVSVKNAAWIMDGHKSAQLFSMDQAEALRHAPYHLFSSANGRFYNLVDFPTFRQHESNASWTEGTVGTATGAVGATGPQLISGKFAHAPAVSAIPTLLKGRRGLLDTVQGKACSSIQYVYDLSLPPVAMNEATREAAWNWRDVLWAAFLSPTSGPMGAHGSYFQDQAQRIATYLNGRVSTWTAEQSVWYGLHRGYYGAGNYAVATWMQGYLATSIGLAALHEFDIAAFAAFAAHYWATAAVTTTTPNGSYPAFPALIHAYYLTVGTGNSSLYSTWQQISDASGPAGGAVVSDEVYHRLALTSMHILSDVLSAPGNITAALAAYEGSAAGHTALGYRSSAQFSIVRSGFTRT